MSLPLPPLRPQASRGDSKSNASGPADSNSAQCPCTHHCWLASEVHELRARLDGLQQLIASMNRKLDLYSYTLNSIAVTTQEDQETWPTSYELDITQAADYQAFYE
ncbi:hypothetical protein F5B17DRAFT_436342 [Nemania serpens]|nr:hypothetical protein F5B17DRAFT_436342 [Nemania serpens]